MSHMKRLMEDQDEARSELQAMVKAYDGVGTFPEFVQRYTQEHPSQYDFSAIAQCIIPPKDPRLKKHNGKLDDYAVHDWRHASVQMQPDYTARDGSQLVVIYGRYAEGTSYISIDPKQALSLLEWLNQNREKLEQLAQP